MKHVVTAKTEINNGDKSAKFKDIKVGDFVSGLRLKKSDTEYEVVKITKFGPETKKAEAPGDLVDARRDEHGLLLDEERLPQRVRIKKSPTSL